MLKRVLIFLVTVAAALVATAVPANASSTDVWELVTTTYATGNANRSKVYGTITTSSGSTNRITLNIGVADLSPDGYRARAKISVYKTCGGTCNILFESRNFDCTAGAGYSTSYIYPYDPNAYFNTTEVFLSLRIEVIIGRYDGDTGTWVYNPSQTQKRNVTLS